MIFTSDVDSVREIRENWPWVQQYWLLGNGSCDHITPCLFISDTDRQVLNCVTSCLIFPQFNQTIHHLPKLLKRLSKKLIYPVAHCQCNPWQEPWLYSDLPLLQRCETVTATLTFISHHISSLYSLWLMQIYWS